MTPSRPAPDPLAFEKLEGVYETLAGGIDRAGAARESVFLAKLALILAHRAGIGVDFADCVETALRDLDVVARPLKND